MDGNNVWDGPGPDPGAFANPADPVTQPELHAAIERSRDTIRKNAKKERTQRDGRFVFAFEVKFKATEEEWAVIQAFIRSRPVWDRFFSKTDTNLTVGQMLRRGR